MAGDRAQDEPSGGGPAIHQRRPPNDSCPPSVGPPANAIRIGRTGMRSTWFVSREARTCPCELAVLTVAVAIAVVETSPPRIARKGLGPANTTRPRHRPRTMPENTNSQRPQLGILRTVRPSSGPTGSCAHSFPYAGLQSDQARTWIRLTTPPNASGHPPSCSAPSFGLGRHPTC